MPEYFDNPTNRHYYHRDDILHHDIYSRYVDNEELSDGDLQWIYADFGSDKSKIKEALKEMEMGIHIDGHLQFILCPVWISCRHKAICL